MLVVYELLCQKNKYPWMALVYSLVQKETYICGGALIASKYVLSTAHCIQEGETEVLSPASHIRVTNSQSQFDREILTEFRSYWESITWRRKERPRYPG